MRIILHVWCIGCFEINSHANALDTWLYILYTRPIIQCLCKYIVKSMCNYSTANIFF